MMAFTTCYIDGARVFISTTNIDATFWTWFNLSVIKPFRGYEISDWNSIAA